MPTDLSDNRAGLAALARRATASPAAPAPPRSMTPVRPAYPWTTRIALPAGIVIALLVLLGISAADALRPAVDVRIVPVVMRGGEATDAASATAAPAHAGAPVVQAAGWVEPDPYAVSVTALTDGVVRQVHVLEGQTVQAGQVVTSLVDEDAKLALAKAEADLRQRQAELHAARQVWDHPVDREQAVATADAAVAEAQAELVRLTSDVGAEAARVAELAEQYERTKRNFESSAATQLELTGLQRRLEAQRATLEATQAKRPVIEAQLRQREAELEAARRNAELRIDEARAVQTADAAVAMAAAVRDEAKLRLDRTQIRAPVDGVVLSRHVEPGSKLMLAMDHSHSATAVRLYDPKRLQVRVDVPLADAAKVGVGMAAEVVVGVLPDRAFRGEVTRVVHEADVSKNTLQVKVAIKDPTPQLRPEMLARVKFLGQAADASPTTGPQVSAGGQRPFVPESLVQRESSGSFVWIVDRRDDTARRRAIELGTARKDEWISVTSGLAAGDMVIASPSGLSDGTRVRIAGEADISR